MSTDTQPIDARTRQLIEEPNFAFAATLREDGSPQVVPVWVHLGEDGLLELNSAEGRAWPANVRRDPRVAISVPNRESAYEYVEVRGRVVDVTTDDADAHIDMLAKKYLDEDSYPFRKESEVRLKIRVQPERVRYHGGG